MIDSVLERAPVAVFILSVVIFALSIFYAFAPNTFTVYSANKVSTIFPTKIVSGPATGDFELTGYQVANNPVYAQE